MPPIKRAKALFFSISTSGRPPAIAILGAVRGLGSRPDVRHRFVVDPASLK
jgi:hypothetical protein